MHDKQGWIPSNPSKNEEVRATSTFFHKRRDDFEEQDGSGRSLQTFSISLRMDGLLQSLEIPPSNLVISYLNHVEKNAGKETPRLCSNGRWRRRNEGSVPIESNIMSSIWFSTSVPISVRRFRTLPRKRAQDVSILRRRIERFIFPCSKNRNELQMEEKKLASLRLVHGTMRRNIPTTTTFPRSKVWTKRRAIDAFVQHRFRCIRIRTFVGRLARVAWRKPHVQEEGNPRDNPAENRRFDHENVSRVETTWWIQCTSSERV